MMLYVTDSNARKISLDGLWDFNYTHNISDEDGKYEIPAQQRFVTKMPVPGYWDDNINFMQEYDFWSDAEFNNEFRHIDFPMGDSMPPDASLPYLVGVGWYRKAIHIPAEWQSKHIELHIGGVVLEAWVWVNGNHIKYHLGHSTPFEVSISHMLKFGEKNEIMIAVANTRKDRLGCVIRGFKGFSAGIYRSVYLKVSQGASIKDCYIYPSAGMESILCQVKLVGAVNENMSLHWAIKDPCTDKVISSGIVPVHESHLQWSTDSASMKPWSDRFPKLYDMEITLLKGKELIDAHKQSFGVRRLHRDGVSLRLNGQPVTLRGATEHAYFPLTCTPPGDIETYRKNIRRLKELGFNWLRFHTWVPSEEYMLTADQMGIMIQVEPPLGFEAEEWKDILYTCRKHPSVVIYCCGNEELLDENKIELLREMSVMCRKIVPDALFNPQEAMRGIEYAFRQSEEEKRIALENNVKEPFNHNPKRLNAIREFSDVFGQYPSGLLSYLSVTGKWQTLNARLKIYQRPCLSHEIGINGSYINLDLEHRYQGTRIGSEIYASVRRNLKKEGLLSRANTYYRNSCAWMKILRKHLVENARKCMYIAGYDLLGAIDYHWHRSGYTCGVMNEFYELKLGESAEDVLEYNGESVLLLDHSNDRNLQCGDTLCLDLYSSLYGKEKMEKGVLFWYLSDEKRNIYQRGEKVVENICNGRKEKLSTIQISAPKIEQPSKITLYTRLSGGEYEIKNHWDFWVFPEFVQPKACVTTDWSIAEKFKDILTEVSAAETADSVLVCSELNKKTMDFLNDGGKVVLLGNKPFQALPTTFQISIAGRVQGNLATVIEDHPLMNRFPHDGFCDWQFYNMLEGGNVVLFNHLKIPFKPIVEVVSTFKLIRKQASLFELCVGKGKLLLCTFRLNETDPAAKYLLKLMIAYAESIEFNPDTYITVSDLEDLMNMNNDISYNFITDQAFDPNVNKKRK